MRSRNAFEIPLISARIILPRELHRRSKADNKKTRTSRMMSSDEPASTPLQTVQAFLAKSQRQYQQTLDRWTPHVLQRWLATFCLVALFMLRIVLSQGVSVRLVSSLI